RRRNGATETVTVTTIPRAFSSPKTENVSARLLDGRTGYVRIRSFNPTAMDAWRSAETQEAREKVLVGAKRELGDAFAKIARTERPVLALRGNFGGTDRRGMLAAQHLLEPGLS